MKSKHTSKDTSTFPALYRNTAGAKGMVVLANGIGYGTVVHAIPTGFPLGYYCTSWVSFDDTTEWERLADSDEVVLSN